MVDASGLVDLCTSDKSTLAILKKALADVDRKARESACTAKVSVPSFGDGASTEGGSWSAPDFILNRERRAELDDRLNHPPRAKIMVMGEMKAGKSTLWNVLMHEELLPSAPTACTSRVTTLMHSDPPKVWLCCADDDGSVSLPTRAQEQKQIKKLEDVWGKELQNKGSLEGLLGRGESSAEMAVPPNVHEVKLGLPKEFLQGGLQLVDSPGLAERTDLNLLVQKHLTGQGGVRPADIILYVVAAASGGLKERDIETLEQIPAAARDRLMVVVTKVDLITSRSDEDESDDEEEKARKKADLETILSTIFQQFKERGFGLLQESSYKACPHFHPINLRRVVKAQKKRRPLPIGFRRLERSIIAIVHWLGVGSRLAVAAECLHTSIPCRTP
jgi:predicted GTPase